MSPIELDIIQTKEDYNCFLLLYAAHADYDFSDDERSFIKSKCSIEIFEKILDHFENLSEYARLQVILQNKDQYMACDQDRTNYFDSIKALFNSDGEYSKLEKTLLNFLNHLL